MTFLELREYLDSECGCTIEPLEEGLYLAKNCINGKVCLIEDLDFYSIQTLCHYFYELYVDIPESIQDFAHVYMNFRKMVDGIGIVSTKENL